MDLLKFLVVVAVILALHFLLWGKIYRVWYGGLKGSKKVFLFLACLLAEALMTIFLGIAVLNLGQ
jgi:hypothetical protein